MNTELAEGDLVWVNRFAKSYSSNLIIHRKQKQMTLMEEYTIPAIIVDVYPDLCYVWVIKDEEFHYFFKEDLKCQE